MIEDFIDYERLDTPVPVKMAANPISIVGFGTVLIDHFIHSKGTIWQCKTCLYLVSHIPKLTGRLLSLGAVLQQSLCINVDAANITLSSKGIRTPILQCVHHTPGETLYWVEVKSSYTKTIKTVFKEDYDLMHQHLGHPSKDVLQCAKDYSKGFPEGTKFPLEDSICPGCAKGKMPSRSFP